MRYTTEVALAVAIEVVDATRGEPATRGAPPEPDFVALRVQLGALEITDALPLEVLAELELDALDRLRRLADEP
jgi:hypothetical protein